VAPNVYRGGVRPMLRAMATLLKQQRLALGVDGNVETL
jgi:hypothetical protein